MPTVQTVIPKNAKKSAMRLRNANISSLLYFLIEFNALYTTSLEKPKIKIYKIQIGNKEKLKRIVCGIGALDA
jgi:hypothetical protein